MKKPIYKVRIWHTVGIFKHVDYEESGWTNKRLARYEASSVYNRVKRNLPKGTKVHFDIVRA